MFLSQINGCSHLWLDMEVPSLLLTHSLCDSEKRLEQYLLHRVVMRNQCGVSCYQLSHSQ